MTAEAKAASTATTRAVLPDIADATEEDWDTEYLAPVLSIRVVPGLDDAIEHIHEHGSGHTDAIVTEDINRAQRFLDEAGACGYSIEPAKFVVVSWHQDIDFPELPEQRPLSFLTCVAKAAVLPHQDDDRRYGQCQSNEKPGIDVPLETQRTP